MTEKLTDKYETPPEFFNWCSKEFGPFDLDVCASDENHKCKRYFTIKDNGLSYKNSWESDTFWCNPPYSKPLPWVQRAVAVTGNDIARRGVMLLKLDPSTRWYALVEDFAKHIVLLAPRLQFIPSAELSAVRRAIGLPEVMSNNFCSMLALFGDWGIWELSEDKYFFRRWK